MKLSTIVAVAIHWLMVNMAWQVHAQQVGTLTPEVHPSLTTSTCTKDGGCVMQTTKIVLDANWRWLHQVGSYSNCFNGNWNCGDETSCARNCALEGVNYQTTYGITTDGHQLQLNYVTNGNVGSRVYLMENDSHYRVFKLLNQEFTFDVDASQLVCGMNGALYFSEMDPSGDRSDTNAAGATYGTGYCDAQCPKDKFIKGQANFGNYGACCAEFDIWEANSRASAMTSHPCRISAGLYKCQGNDCGDVDRYGGVCDKDGCDYNPFRLGNHNFYGLHQVVDTTAPITVVTQFITDDNTPSGDLVEVRRIYKQHGVVLQNAAIAVAGIDPVNSLSDNMCAQQKNVFNAVNDHANKGGLKQMGEALRRGVVLVMSIWDDFTSYMHWLDSTFPENGNPNAPGVMRGPCPTNGGHPWELRQQNPNAYVRFANVRVGDIDSTY